jgi:hypothetical protein
MLKCVEFAQLPEFAFQIVPRMYVHTLTHKNGTLESLGVFSHSTLTRHQDLYTYLPYERGKEAFGLNVVMFLFFNCFQNQVTFTNYLLRRPKYLICFRSQFMPYPVCSTEHTR